MLLVSVILIWVFLSNSFLNKSVGFFPRELFLINAPVDDVQQWLYVILVSALLLFKTGDGGKPNIARKVFLWSQGLLQFEFLNHAEVNQWELKVSLKRVSPFRKLLNTNVVRLHVYMNKPSSVQYFQCLQNLYAHIESKNIRFFTNQRVLTHILHERFPSMFHIDFSNFFSQFQWNYCWYLQLSSPKIFHLW